MSEKNQLMTSSAMQRLLDYITYANRLRFLQKMAEKIYENFNSGKVYLCVNVFT